MSALPVLRVLAALKSDLQKQIDITDAITTIDEAMLQQTWMEIEYRLYVLRTTNGANGEV